jgi:hypothetical protein
MTHRSPDSLKNLGKQISAERNTPETYIGVKGESAQVLLKLGLS